jgi:hypothetical protein
MGAVTVALKRKRVNYVLDADIRGFYEHIDHEWLMQLLQHRVADLRMLRLIQKWLKTGVMEEGQRSETEMGSARTRWFFKSPCREERAILEASMRKLVQPGGRRVHHPQPGTRISAETFKGISAADLIALLDSAGIRRALVPSVAYTWGSANRSIQNEYEFVKAENDWTSRQVAQYPDRLRGSCSARRRTAMSRHPRLPPRFASVRNRLRAAAPGRKHGGGAP